MSKRAKSALERGDFALAAQLSHQMALADPSDAQAKMHLGVALTGLQRYADAERTLRDAMALRPGDPHIACALADPLRIRGQTDEAREVLEAALAGSPGNAAIVGARAELHNAEGEYAEALALLEPIIADAPVTAVAAYGTAARNCGRAGDAVGVIRARLEGEGVTPSARRALLFQLGGLLDSVGEYAEAFEAFRLANEATGASFNPEAHRASVDRLIAAWSKEALAGLPRSKQASELPVVIVGMPRSGTTLAEQIIASHPQAEAGDELTLLHQIAGRFEQVDYRAGSPHLVHVERLSAEALTGAAGAYITGLRGIGPKALRVTDKMPDNFLHLGLVAVMVPGARVIHCVRDAVDTCLSCYFHSFGGPYHFAYDLEHLGSYYRDYERLMSHWDSLDVGGTRVAYETLVSNQEAESRRIVEGAGLGWDEACLRFHESSRMARTNSRDQVRRPMYRSSVGRRDHYEPYIGKLVDALGVG